MKHKRLSFLSLGVGLLLVAVSAILLTIPASAQCGSQASSCKNCHETQAQKPVNNDGTAWHTSHAFGDFCYLCHGGNNQATDVTAAHTGMTDPLTDIATACKSCHPTDFTDKAQIYATTLGVALTNTGSASTTTSGGGSTTGTTSTSGTSGAAPAAAVAVPAADMVDYSSRYNQVALGQQPVNWGNVILIVLALGMLLGGGYFIVRREGLLRVTFAETKAIQEGYPTDVVDLVPAIAKLKPEARQSLARLLAKPGTAGELLKVVDQLSQPTSQPTSQPPAQPDPKPEADKPEEKE